MDNFSLASMASHKNIYFREVMTRDELWWIGPYLILLIHMIQIRTYLFSHNWQVINWRSGKCLRSKSLLLDNLHLLQEHNSFRGCPTTIWAFSCTACEASTKCFTWLERRGPLLKTIFEMDLWASLFWDRQDIVNVIQRKHRTSSFLGPPKRQNDQSCELDNFRMDFFT